MTAASTAATLRARRAELVDDVAAGRLDMASLPPDADLVKTVVLAQAVPGVGKVRSRRILAERGIEDATRWGELSVEQRIALAADLKAAGASPAAGM